MRIDNVWCWYECVATGTFTYEVSREAIGWYLFMSFCLLHVYGYYSKKMQALIKDTGIRMCTTFFERAKIARNPGS